MLSTSGEEGERNLIQLFSCRRIGESRDRYLRRISVSKEESFGQKVVRKDSRVYSRSVRLRCDVSS